MRCCRCQPALLCTYTFRRSMQREKSLVQRYSRSPRLFLRAAAGEQLGGREGGELMSQQETPPGRNPAARSRDERESGFDGVGSFTVLDLGRRDSQAQLLADCARK